MNRRRLLATAAAIAAGLETEQAAGAPEALSALLSRVRREHEVPALASLVMRDGKVLALAVVGVRKQGDPTPVTVRDRFHLGSCTKAITAALVGLLVEEKRLRWELTLAEGFPDLRSTMRPDWRAVTVDHLLQHRSGIPSMSWPKGKTFSDMHALPGTPRRQRQAYVELILQEPLDSRPGEKYTYSNANYALLGALAERVTDSAWEDLVRNRIYRPLGITTGGFGAMGTAGRVEQPWQHRRSTGAYVPIEPGPRSDNPAVIGPGATAHMALEDWSRFTGAVLAGAAGRSGLLRAATTAHLVTPRYGGNYAGGWLVLDRPWAGGRALSHAGSNTQNFCVAWLAPLREFMVLVATNAGGDDAFPTCDAVAAGAIREFLTQGKV